MNIDIIIEEELNEARERIKARIASMLLGGGAPDAPAVAAPSPAPVRPKSSDEHVAEATRRRAEDAQRLFDAIQSKPGLHGRDYAEMLGFEGTQGPFGSARNKLMNSKRIMSRGDRASTVYFIHPKHRAAAPQQELALAKEDDGAFPLMPTAGSGRLAGLTSTERAKWWFRQEYAVMELIKEHPGLTSRDMYPFLALESGNAQLKTCLERLRKNNNLRVEGERAGMRHYDNGKKLKDPTKFKTGVGTPPSRPPSLIHLPGKGSPERQLMENALVDIVAQNPGIKSDELKEKMTGDLTKLNAKDRFTVIKGLLEQGRIRKNKLSGVLSEYFIT